MNQQERLQQIHDKIKNMLPENLQIQENTSGCDTIDTIMEKLSLLETEQKKLSAIRSHDNSRIETIIEMMPKFAVLDFSEKIPFSEKRDEIDAIAAGLNTLAEEFNHLLNVQAEHDEQLNSKARQLEEANLELEAFSYSVSHDLRAPLRAIQGYSRIMAEDYSASLNEEGARLLSAIVANAEKMSQLISDLLEFSRLGRKELQKTKIDVLKIAKSAFAVLNDNRTFEGEIIFHNMPPVLADRSLITQVFLNLIGNAIKYSSKKEKPLIEIGCHELPEGAVFYVKDNGAGFNMKYYDRLFEVFRRLHPDKQFEGTGVGLAIVKRIVQRHGGRVWAEGRVNEGATFYFTLTS